MDGNEIIGMTRIFGGDPQHKIALLNELEQERRVKGKHHE